MRPCAIRRRSDARWRPDPASDQCRPACRSAASGGIGSRRHRPLPHRAAFHDGAKTCRGSMSQIRHYSAVLDAAGDRPVTFRTLDIGADKSLPYLRQPKEDNPAMGWRAIRLAIDRPALLKLQLRALLKAAAGRDLRVMFPMIADVAEFRAAKALVEEEKAYLQPARPRFAELDQAWRDDRGAGADLATRRASHRGRFRIDRLERPPAVPVCLGSRQFAPCRRAMIRSVRRCSRRSDISSYGPKRMTYHSICAAKWRGGRSRPWR